MKKQPQPIHTTMECSRQENGELFTRIDTFEDGKISELILEHQKNGEKDFLEINATGFTGLLTNPTITQYLREMNKNLRASSINSLKIVGLTEKNCEADLFRRQIENYYMDGSFSNVKEVVCECGYLPEEIERYNLQPTTLPSKPFLKAELDFIKFDGYQIIPQNFLANALSVESIVCPDNDNTHSFITPFTEDKYINVVITNASNTEQASTACDTPAEQ